MKSRFAVLSGCLDNYLPLAQTTIYQNKSDYCLRHGYDLQVCRSVGPAYANPASHASGFSWARLAMMLQLLECGRYDWVYCVGCDTMITNFEVTLDDLIEFAGIPNGALPMIALKLPPGVPAPVIKSWEAPDYKPDGQTHVIFAADRASVMQADSFLIRASGQGIGYLRDILASYPIYKTQPWVEQQAMADLRFKHAAVMRIVPQWAMNSYNYRLYDHYGPYYRDGVDCYGKRGQWKMGDFLIHWPSTSLEQRLKLADEYSQQVIK